jgi:hypothetical protein
LKDDIPDKSVSNYDWLKKVCMGPGVILLGGSPLSHFRVRVAQSHLRSDLLPSFWSLSGILLDTPDVFLSVPLELTLESSRMPALNAIRECRISDYDDPVKFPNIAYIRFAQDMGPVLNHLKALRTQRALIDLPGLMIPWLAFIWGVGDGPNPLVHGKGLPCAAFVESLFAVAGMEITPGISSGSTCPEAIWQSVKWWSEYFARNQSQQVQDAGNIAGAAVSAPAPQSTTPASFPHGYYMIRQPAASVHEI